MQDGLMVPKGRPLTDAERATLDRLLESGSSRAAALRKQLPVTTVAGRCDCGCPSVYLGVDGRHVSTETIEVLYESELQVVGDDEEPVADVLLFLKSDTLHYLEYVSHNGEQPQSWPDPSRLRKAN
jgi:hypothetical protein